VTLRHTPALDPVGPAAARQEFCRLVRLERPHHPAGRPASGLETMNIQIEAKDVVLVLVGVAGSVVASYIYRYLENSSSATQALERDLDAADPVVRDRATRQCLLTAAKFFVFANVFSVVSALAWVFGNALYNLTLLVLGASSVIAILLLWGAVRWLMRAQKGNGG
jgi:hypothetical protein